MGTGIRNTDTGGTVHRRKRKISAFVGTIIIIYRNSSGADEICQVEYDTCITHNDISMINYVSMKECIGKVSRPTNYSPSRIFLL